MTMQHTRIHQCFDERVAQAPDQPFLFLPDGEMTLRELSACVDQLEAELRADGVRPGDRVLVAAENCPEHVALVLACSRVGAWACGVNARMTAAEHEGGKECAHDSREQRREQHEEPRDDLQ